MPEILEMSGLDDADNNASVGIGGILALAGIAYTLKLIGDWLGEKKSKPLGLVDIGSLGLIKKCRKQDMKSGKAKKDQVWCLWNKKGNRILGRHPTRNRALKQEHLIQWKKKR